jgi:hypothetical protein
LGRSEELTGLRREHRGPAQNPRKREDWQETRYETAPEEGNVASCRHPRAKGGPKTLLVNPYLRADFLAPSDRDEIAQSYSLTRK